MDRRSRNISLPPARGAVRLICCLALALLPLSAMSQIPRYIDLVDNDVWIPVEALHLEHESAISLLTARSALAAVNDGLSSAASAAGIRYDSIRIDLDRYTRMFDIIDKLYNTLHLAFRSANTFSDIEYYASRYADVIRSFIDELDSHGRLLAEDMCLFDYAASAIGGLRSDCEQLYSTFEGLASYMLPVPGLEQPANCSASTLTYLLSEIDRFLTRISGRLERLYDLSYRYMLMRQGYWPVSVITQTKGAIVSSALSRWMEKGREAGGGDSPAMP